MASDLEVRLVLNETVLVLEKPKADIRIIVQVSCSSSWLPRGID